MQGRRVVLSVLVLATLSGALAAGRMRATPEAPVASLADAPAVPSATPSPVPSVEPVQVVEPALPELDPSPVEGLLFGRWAGEGDGATTVKYMSADLRGRDLLRRRQLGDAARRFVPSRDGRFLAWSDGDSVAVAASARIEETNSVYSAKKGRIRVLAVSHDGRYVAVMNHSGDQEDPYEFSCGIGEEEPDPDAWSRLLVVDVEAGSAKRVRALDGTKTMDCMRGAAFDSTGSRLAVVGCPWAKSPRIVVLDLDADAIVSMSRAVSYSNVEFDPSLSTAWFVAPGSDDQPTALVRFDLESGKRTTLYRSSAKGYAGDAVHLREDGTHVIINVSDENGAGFAYELNARRRNPRVLPKTRMPAFVAVSPDDRFLLVYKSNSSGLALYDRLTGRSRTYAPDGGTDRFLWGAWIVR